MTSGTFIHIVYYIQCFMKFNKNDKKKKEIPRHLSKYCSYFKNLLFELDSSN